MPDEQLKATLGATVMVVDDDPRARRLVGHTLERAGYTVLPFEDGVGVARLVTREPVDLVVLDLNMPNVSGLSALRAIRAARQDVGVIILTGSEDDRDLDEAFAAGADDFVRKPARPQELLSRVQAVLRRTRLAAAAEGDTAASQSGGLSLDPVTHEAVLDGNRIPLTPTEFQLLKTLVRGVGRVFTPADLLRQVWGPEYVGQDEIVRTNIYRLRRKLEPDPGNPRYLISRVGVGYFFARPTTENGSGNVDSISSVETEPSSEAS